MDFIVTAGSTGILPSPPRKILLVSAIFCVIHQVLGILSVVGAVNIGIQKGERYSPYKFIKCIIMYYKW